MTNHIPRAVCRQLARVDKKLRYGIAMAPGQGVIAFLAALVPDKVVGHDDLGIRSGLVFQVKDIGDRLVAFYDADGSFPCKIPAGYRAVLMGWPGQNTSFGMADVIAGNHASFVEHFGKPQHVVEQERRTAIAAEGRQMDTDIKAEAADMADKWAYLARDPGSSDPVYTNETLRQKYDAPENQEFFMNKESAYENSFQKQYLVDAGLEKR